MPRTEYVRRDFGIRLRVDDDGTETLLTSVGGGPEVIRESVSALGPLISAWIDGLEQVAPDRVPINRVTIDVQDLDASARWWEAMLAEQVGPLPVILVRTTAMRARALELPLTLPLRMLEIDPRPGDALGPVVAQVFGGYQQEIIDAAMAFWQSDLVEDVILPPDWTAADIVHFTSLRTLDSPDVLLSSAATTPGSLGWLARFAEKWQTRLVVVNCQGAEQAARARQLGSALVQRGGPAVLVGGLAGGVSNDYRQFYWDLVHDGPLDLAMRQVWAPTLFAGGGREESLRVSSVGVRLLQLEEMCSRAARTEIITESFGVAPEIRDLFNRTIQPVDEETLHPIEETLQADLSSFKADWTNLSFDLHEGGGFLPLSQTVQQIRGSVGARAPIAWESLGRMTVSAAPRRRPAGTKWASGRLPSIPILPEPTREIYFEPVEPGDSAGAIEERGGARYLNASLWEDHGGRLSRVESAVTRGPIYQLGVQIGPRDTFMVTFGAAAIVEELLRFTPGSTGVWVEVGVTGLDFEVLGNPVQELWLPRTGASEMLYIPVLTTTPKVFARLRVCLYYGNQVLQSLRLDAALNSKLPLFYLADDLAAASGPVLRDVFQATHLEYNLATSPEQVDAREPRRLCVVANDLDGVSVVTVKGKELFGTRTNNDVPRLVRNVRDAMQAVSFPPSPQIRDPRDYPYGFGTSTASNVGTEATLKHALMQMATPGWRLYDAILPAKVREPLTRSLAEPDAVIHVAHVLLEKIIPWAALYDRKYDEDLHTDEHGAPVAHDTCLAAIDRDGSLRPGVCGTHPDCVLHASALARLAAAGQPVPLPDSVVCPRYFWGFRHTVEIPAQQVDDEASDAPPQATRIPVSGKAQLAAGLNARLESAAAHVLQLEDLVKAPGVSAVWKAAASTRAAILKSLNDPDLHVVYLYCHAHGGLADPGVYPPYLEFYDAATGTEEKITSDQLQAAAWSNSPLVILNGCGTVGFSPDALSPFVVKLVQDRGAGGVLGTEIPVSEDLAREMAMLFLGRFLNRESAGAALRAARRGLLAKGNPLGLVYVLYSAADLQLALV